MCSGTVVTRRLATDGDAAFRFVLFRDSRASVEGLVGADPILADQLLRHQFTGREASYRAAYPQAVHHIVEVDGVPVGGVVTDQGADAILLVDIALLPDWQGRGIGTHLLRAVQGEARAAGVPLRLSVLGSNVRARRLYARLGFLACDDIDGLHLTLRWTP